MLAGVFMLEKVEDRIDGQMFVVLKPIFYNNF